MKNKNLVFINFFSYLLNRNKPLKEKLIKHSGKKISLYFDLIQFNFKVAEDGNVTEVSDEIDSHVSIKVPFSSFPKLLLGVDELKQDIEIHGNANIASDFAYVLSNLNLNYEKDLVKIFGEFTANRIVNFINLLKSYFKNSSRSLIISSRDYIVYEKKVLLCKDENQLLADKIQNYSHRVEHLFVRLNNLEKIVK